MNATISVSISLPPGATANVATDKPTEQPPLVLVAQGLGKFDNQRTLAWRGEPGCVLLLDSTLSANLDPNPATMYVLAADGTTQLATLDYNGADTGVPCRIVYNGQNYSTSLTNGDFILPSAV